MSKLRVGVIGVGGMGNAHSSHLTKIDKADFVAVCDADRAMADQRASEYGVKAFYDAKEMYNSGEIDAVIIAVPHYAHTPLAIAAFEAGIHVLCEKPVGVHKADVQKMIEAHKARPELKFGAMFQMRTMPLYKKLKSLIVSGELGKIMRINWTVTNWFRTQSYYDSGSWRATWKGEGGGVLLNQCPHQLDLFQWLFGQPSSIRAFCSIGKYHNIEVEDDVTAFCEYPCGATSVFITSTGEAPGTNRLEIVTDRGRVVVEDDKIIFTRTEQSVKDFCATSPLRFGTPDCWEIEIPVAEASGNYHSLVIDNFIDAVLDGTELIAPAADGINSVEIGNSMIFSSMNGVTVDLPLDSEAYAELLQKLVDESGFVKEVKDTGGDEDFTSSFNK